MNLPFLVVPYSLSPEPWYTFVFRFTQTRPFDFAEAMSLEVAGVGAAFGAVVLAAGAGAVGAGLAAGAGLGAGAGLDIAIVVGAVAVFAAGVVVLAGIAVLAADAFAALAAAFFCAFVCAGVVVVVVACAKATGCANASVAERIVPSVMILMRFFFIADTP
jgi:hypothetical protein